VLTAELESVLGQVPHGIRGRTAKGCDCRVVQIDEPLRYRKLVPIFPP
jgi:hypothetical protein